MEKGKPHGKEPKLSAPHPARFAQKEQMMDAGSLLKKAAKKITK